MALFHLLRNIGSSLFISLSVAEIIQRHDDELQPHDGADHALQPGADDAWADGRLDDARRCPASPRSVREINRQAAMIGYINAFGMYTLASAAAILLVLLARRRPRPA